MILLSKSGNTEVIILAFQIMSNVNNYNETLIKFG